MPLTDSPVSFGGRMVGETSPVSSAEAVELGNNGVSETGETEVEFRSGGIIVGRSVGSPTPPDSVTFRDVIV